MTNYPSHEISVLWVAESNWTPGSGIKPHSHDYYHMLTVRQGPMEFTLGEETLRLETGETLLAHPDVIHGMHNHVTAPIARVYEIKFTVQAPRLRDYLAGLPAVLPATDFSAVLTRELVEESARQQPSTPAMVADYLFSLLSYYGRHYGRQSASQTAIIDTAGYSAVSCHIVQYLEENFAKEIPLQEIADVVGFNKNYICSVFKRDAGITIGSCQTVIRIRKAAEMISFSDMTMAQVAAATGFSNLSHFNRIFKKVAGIPPGQYRRMFTADMLVSQGGAESVNAALAQNGFIVSVLGRKMMTISEIISFINQETADPAEATTE